MASPDNLASIEPCTYTFRPTIVDSWFTEANARDADILTKTETLFPFRNLIAKPETTHSPTVSGLSGLDQEPAPKRQRTGKVSKKRAPKRSQTTFITADPANFRCMVQQVTGVRFGNSQVPTAPVLKPQPQRVGDSPLAAAGGWLPTLDTSELLLDHHRQQPVPLPDVPPVGVGVFDDAGFASVTATSGLDFGTFSSFPTQDSWNVMMRKV